MNESKLICGVTNISMQMTNTTQSHIISFIRTLTQDQLDEMIQLSERLGYNPNNDYTQIDKYNPIGLRVSDDALVTFLRTPLSGDLTEIPGLGASTAQVLARGTDPVTTSHQLIGVYLTMRSADLDTLEVISMAQHCDRFWNWLKLKGVNSYRNEIVSCVAEKANTMMPGLYDPDQL
jgi:hypothetical protein